MNQAGHYNVAVGYEAGRGTAVGNKTGGVFIGYQAGKNENGNNKLYIENSSSSTPLIGGDFSADEVYLNGNVGINTNTPAAELEVNGQVIVDGQIQITGGNPGANKVLMSDASGLASWSAQGGGGGVGASMHTSYMNSNNMFTPHANDCGTDAFVPLFDGATVGYCMERDERPSNYWSVAVRTCLEIGKRLPEQMEFETACENRVSLGLNGMIENSEWVSNFPTTLVRVYEGVSGDLFVEEGVYVARAGYYGSCWSKLGMISTNSSFRCVR